MPRTIRLLNQHGDLTIGWTENQDEKARAWIEARMAEGYTFFHTNSAGQELRAKSFSDLVASGRKVTLGDKDADELLWDGTFVMLEDVTTPQADADEEIVTAGRAKTADEVMKGDTVAVKPAAGG